MLIYRQTDRRMERQTDDRDRQTYRWEDGQADRDRQTDTHTHRYTQTYQTITVRAIYQLPVIIPLNSKSFIKKIKRDKRL